MIGRVSREGWKGREGSSWESELAVDDADSVDFPSWASPLADAPKSGALASELPTSAALAARGSTSFRVHTTPQLRLPPSCVLCGDNSEACLVAASPGIAIVDDVADPLSNDVTATLLAHRHEFKAFLASRVGNEADAEDLLQNGLVKALQRVDEIKDEEKAVAWFYQLLRNAVIDHARSRTAAAQRDHMWASDFLTLADDAEAKRHLCACFEKLLPGLKPAHAELLRRVELKNEPVADAAAALGITANHASVLLHRARAELRKTLVDFCGDCSCLNDCQCA